ncbi:MAG: hypothetical protein IT376_03160 [Polyangiaceae bacterium]|nr:hypothetical protein [Polyangiaceae bacterium]
MEPPREPSSLASMQVDLTNRLGELRPPFSTGLARLDAMLQGGLRSGTLFALGGEPGSGRTALALALAYMAARARVAALVAGATLDPAEVLARYAARALHRERPLARLSYGDILAGAAWSTADDRAQVTHALETVLRKVGPSLHVQRLAPGDSASALAAAAERLWSRQERAAIVVDGIEALAAGAGASHEAALVRVSHELFALADRGAAVVVTCGAGALPHVATAAHVVAELRAVPSGGPLAPPDDLAALGARKVDLVVVANSRGSGGVVPLRFVPGAALFEERAP